MRKRRRPRRRESGSKKKPQRRRNGRGRRREAKAKAERERKGQESLADPQMASLRPPETPTPLPRVELKQLSIIAKKRDLSVAERMELTVKGQYSDGTEVNLKSGVQWKSSDPSVASVNSKGEIQALKEGNTQISATYQGVPSGAYTFNVKASQETRKPEESGGEIKDQRRRLLR